MYSRRQLKKMLSETPINISRIHYLSSGDDSDVYLCDQKYVLKIPLRESVKKIQAREFELYRFLETQNFSFKIPKAIWCGWDFNLMEYLPGSRISNRAYRNMSEREKNQLAQDEALFLSELHTLKPEAIPAGLCESPEDKKATFAGEHIKLLEVLEKKRLLSTRMEQSIHRIYENLFSDSLLFQYSPCLVHNDFSRDNLIFRQHRLFGVIDFGDFGISDPDNDFLCLLDGSDDDFGIAFGLRVLKYYGHPNPEAARRKAELYNAYWPIQQILYGSHRGDRRLFERGFNALMTINPDVFIP